MSLEALSAQRLVAAVFRPGATAAGHHWTIEDEQGNVLLRTERTHRGGRFARAAWKAVTLTGLDAGNDIHLQLVGADDAVVARFESENATPAVVSAMDPHGVPIARSVREGDDLTLYSPNSDLVIASVHTEGDGPWSVLDPLGDKVGELLAGEPGPDTTPSWLEPLVPYAPNTSSDFARTMHLGLRRVMRYALLPEGRPPQAVALLPLFAGLSY